MLKQSIIYIALSILIVIFSAYAHLAIVYIDMFYTWVTLELTPIFSSSMYGTLIRNVFSLVVLPVIIVGIPALIYRVIKGQYMPYFIEITWIIWLIIVLSKVLIR